MRCLVEYIETVVDVRLPHLGMFADEISHIDIGHLIPFYGLLKPTLPVKVRALYGLSYSL
jgi:hypothetical protein